MKKLAAIGVAVIVTTATAPTRSHDHHHHQESFSAGEPGDPKKPSRTIEIAMSEMAYEPLIEV
jgi:hypothetical protein